MTNHLSGNIAMHLNIWNLAYSILVMHTLKQKVNRSSLQGNVGRSLRKVCGSFTLAMLLHWVMHVANYKARAKICLQCIVLSFLPADTSSLKTLHVFYIKKSHFFHVLMLYTIVLGRG